MMLKTRVNYRNLKKSFKPKINLIRDGKYLFLLVIYEL